MKELIYWVQVLSAGSFNSVCEKETWSMIQTAHGCCLWNKKNSLSEFMQRGHRPNVLWILCTLFYKVQYSATCLSLLFTLNTLFHHLGIFYVLSVYIYLVLFLLLVEPENIWFTLSVLQTVNGKKILLLHSVFLKHTSHYYNLKECNK